MDFYIYAVVFMVGSALGSFINVVADRYHGGRSFIRGNSICFSCGNTIRAFDLIPIFSYLILRGRCRDCGHKIPGNLFIVEVIMGVLTVLAFVKSSFLLSVVADGGAFYNMSLFILYTSIFGVIVLISIYDLKHFIIPDIFLFILGSISVILRLVTVFPLSYVVSAVALPLPFLLIFILSKGKWLGLGDVKYMSVIGIMLGFANGLSAVVLAFWIGAVFAIMMLMLKNIIPRIGLLKHEEGLTMKSEIPFGPFLSLGIILSLFFDIDLFNLYTIGIF